MVLMDISQVNTSSKSFQVSLIFSLFSNFNNSYIEYKSWFNNNYPEITSYNIVNFYKLHILYNLSKEFDEILYLDFDVIPIKYENFFEEWDLSKGIAIMDGTAESQKDIATEHASLVNSKYQNNLAQIGIEYLESCMLR